MTAIAQTVQAALYRLLTEEPELSGVVGSVDDLPAVDAARPFIHLGEMTVEPWLAQLLDGRRIIQTVHIWSAFPGASEARSIAENIAELINTTPLSPADVVVADQRFLDAIILREAERSEFHAVVRFQFLAHAVQAT